MNGDMNPADEPQPVKLEDQSAEARAAHEKLSAESGIRMMQRIVILKDDPRMLILVAHGFVELMINALIDENLRNAKRITSDSRGFPHSTKLIILNEVGILDDNLFRVFDWFRKLRNRAAHQPLFELTTNDLHNLNVPHSDPGRFHHTVLDLVLSFWNQHTKLFVRMFIPSLHRAESSTADVDVR